MVAQEFQNIQLIFLIFRCSKDFITQIVFLAVNASFYVGLIMLAVWRPTFNAVHFVILLWRDFICVKIPQRDANKSASRLYVYAPSRVVPPSVFNLPFTCEHQTILHTTSLPISTFQQLLIFVIPVNHKWSINFHGKKWIGLMLVLH